MMGQSPDLSFFFLSFLGVRKIEWWCQGCLKKLQNGFLKLRLHIGKNEDKTREEREIERKGGQREKERQRERETVGWGRYGNGR